jgi:SlyX protein
MNAPTSTSQEELETRLAFIEEHLHGSDRVLGEIQSELLQLQRALQELRERIQNLEPSHIKPLSEETPPPHY